MIVIVYLTYEIMKTNEERKMMDGQTETERSEIFYIYHSEGTSTSVLLGPIVREGCQVKGISKMKRKTNPGIVWILLYT